MLKLNNLLRVPSIIRNLIPLSKISKYNTEYFEFYSNKCNVKSHASSLVLLEGFLDESGLYWLNNINLEPSHNTISNKYKNMYYVINNETSSLRSNNIVSISNNGAIWYSTQEHAHLKVVHSVLSLCNISWAIWSP